MIRSLVTVGVFRDVPPEDDRIFAEKLFVWARGSTAGTFGTWPTDRIVCGVEVALHRFLIYFRLCLKKVIVIFL